MKIDTHSRSLRCESPQDRGQYRDRERRHITDLNFALPRTGRRLGGFRGLSCVRKTIRDFFRNTRPAMVSLTDLPQRSSKSKKDPKKVFHPRTEGDVGLSIPKEKRA